MTDSANRNIKTRHDLFRFFQSQMLGAYTDLRSQKRLSFESNLIKTYVFEVDTLHEDVSNIERLTEYVKRLFGLTQEGDNTIWVSHLEEQGFLEVNFSYRSAQAILYLDTATNGRFWLGFSISNATTLDWWFEKLSREKTDLDVIWLWPSFLEAVQKRGRPRGFSLDYDYRKLQEEKQDKSERTSYLKMQLWGGTETASLYNLLKDSPEFQDKVVLSKIRLKEFRDASNTEDFAIQDLKYKGKFTVRGTDFQTHLSTVNFVREQYEEIINRIEDYALSWKETSSKSFALEGFALHFRPQGFEIPVEAFCEHALDGTMPFRLLGFTEMSNPFSAISEVVDLHTGGELSLEIQPDILSVYLPDGTCGNSIARLYTNLQHFLNVNFTAEADNGDELF